MFGGLTGRVFLFGGAKVGLSAEGAKMRLPKARSLSRLGGLRKHRKLSSGSPQNAEPQNRRDFEHFKPKCGTFWDSVDLTFLNNYIEKIVSERGFIN